MVFFDPVRRDDQLLQLPCALDFDSQRLLRMRAHHLDPVAPERHRRTLDSHDPVTLAQAAPLSRPVRHQFADDRINRRLIRLQTELGHEVAVEIGGGQVGQTQRAQRSVALRGLHVEPGLFALQHPVKQHPARILPARHRNTVDRDENVLLVQHRHGRRGARSDLAQYRLDARHAVNEQEPVQQHRQQQIGDRPGHHDRHALQHRLAVERARQIRCGHLTFALVQHLDVAAERNGGDHPFRLAVAKTFGVHHLAESEREAQHLDIAPARDHVMSQLVEHHQHDDC